MSPNTKQRRIHRVPLSAAALDVLRKIKAIADPNSPFVFPGGTGPLNDIKKSWASVARKAGLEGVRLHDLRHSFASILVSQGASLPLIGQMLGHTQTQTTSRYAHLFDEPLRKAADAVGRAVIRE